jgi:hypothetical protein
MIGVERRLPAAAPHRFENRCYPLKYNPWRVEQTIACQMRAHFERGRLHATARGAVRRSGTIQFSKNKSTRRSSVVGLLWSA